MSEKMISEVITQQGLPSTVASSPSPEQLRDPDLFWTEWVPEFSKQVGTYIGKQRINDWLLSKEGPAWLIQSALVDPTTGVMQRLRETGLYTDDELQLMNQTIIPEYTKAVAFKREREEVEVERITSATQVNRAQVDKLGAQVKYYDEKLKNLGELSQGERANLLTRMARTRQGLLASRDNHVFYADHYTKTDPKKHANTIASNLHSASEIDNLMADLDLKEQQLLDQMSGESMTVQQALPDSISEATQIIMGRHQGLFASPQDAEALFFGEEAPEDPMMAQIRKDFYINLLLLVQQKTDGNLHNVAELMSTGGPGDSYLDQAVGSDVTMPPETSTQAAKAAAGQQ